MAFRCRSNTASWQCAGLALYGLTFFHRGPNLRVIWKLHILDSTTDGSQLLEAA